MPPAACVPCSPSSSAGDASRASSATSSTSSTPRHRSRAAGSSRLLQFSSNGRTEHWQVAVDSYSRDQLKGHGAGTYALDWDRDRRGTLDVENAHSLYLEVLGELGIIGMLALAACLLTILVAFAARARGPDRALYAALFAAATAWMIHAGVDWDWEMPAVTLWLFALGGAALAHAPRPPRTPHRLAPALRVVGVAACLALAIVPVRVALSDKRLDDALTALRDGDCTTATAEANASHDVLKNRAEPFQVIAYCERALGRPDAALAAMQEGLRRDPDNWEMQYGVAVMRAAAGQDPRPAVRRAVRLNPRGDIALAGAQAPVRRRSKALARAGQRRPAHAARLSALLLLARRVRAVLAIRPLGRLPGVLPAVAGDAIGAVRSTARLRQVLHGRSALAIVRDDACGRHDCGAAAGDGERGDDRDDPAKMEMANHVASIRPGPRRMAGARSIRHLFHPLRPPSSSARDRAR